MLAGVLVFIFCLVLAYFILGVIKRQYPWVEDNILRLLFFYHYLLWIAYYVYTRTSRSDSIAYYESIQDPEISWSNLFGTSTTFIKFLAFPYSRYINFTYEAEMVWFAFFGYLGFVFFYIFLKEHIRFNHYFLGIPLITFLLFLPNNHFWTVSLGKGSVIFFGLGLFFYSLGSLKSRFIAMIVGGFLIYYVRPHIMFVILIGLAIGLFSTAKKVSIFIRVFAILATATVLISLYDQILVFTGLEEDLFEQGTNLSNRAKDLGKATSGIDIQSYGIPYQLFTFWFRPLFFDAPGVLGLIVSFENFIYLAILITFLRFDFLRFLWKGDYLVKTAFITTLLGSYPLAQIAGNLGLAIRQKSMFMFILFFLVLYYIDQKKAISLRKYKVYLWKRRNSTASSAVETAGAK